MTISDLKNRKEFQESENLPDPTNGNLQILFKDVDKIVFKQGGVYNKKAMTEDIVLTISQEDSVLRLKSLLEINESNFGFYCMCSGTYAIEFYVYNKLKATIGFHHGVSIRYDGWNSDVELADSDSLLHFLAEQGLRKPLEDRIVEKKRGEISNLQFRKWLENAPKSFVKYLNRADMRIEYPIEQLINELCDEIPDKKQQIITDLGKCFDRLEDKRGINEIFILQNEKNNI